MKKRFRSVVAWTAVLAVMIFNCSIIYADEYHHLRNDEIELILPDSWMCEEIDKGDFEGQSYELIAETYDGAKGEALAMDLYYMSEVIDPMESFYIYDNKEKALEYYEAYGKVAIEKLYAEVGRAVAPEVGIASFYEGDYDGYLVVPVSYEDSDGKICSDLVYLTCEMRYDDEENSVVHKILMFYNDDGTSIIGDDLETVVEIAERFYDYGYGEEGYFDENYGEGSEVFSIIMGLIGILIPILAAIAAIVVAVRKKMPEIKLERKATIGKKPEFDLWKKPKKSQNKPQKKAHDHIGDIMRNNQIDRKDGRRTSTAEERYMASLQTLRKSGLLTREEMQDMLERHERNRSYKRN